MTSILSPHRGALQASVILHTVVTLREGLMENNMENMRKYVKIVMENEDYQRILPQSALYELSKVEEMMKGIINGDEGEELQFNNEKKEENHNDDEREIYQENSYQSTKERSDQKEQYFFSSSPISPQSSNKNPQWMGSGEEYCSINEIEISGSNEVSEIPFILIEESLLQTIPSLIRYC